MPHDIPTITALCASHIDSVARFQRFIKLLKSFDNQSEACQLHISISLDEGLPGYIMESLSKLEVLFSNLHIHLRTIKLSQFEHYQTLANSLNLRPNDYICFSDDDDEWHKDRIKVYREGLKYVIPNSRISSIRFTTKDPHIQHWLEYVDCVTDFATFQLFFATIDKDISRFKFADLLFGTFLQGNQRRGSLIVPTNVPLYNYDFDYTYPRQTSPQFPSSPEFIDRLMVRRLVQNNLEFILARCPAYSKPSITDFSRITFPEQPLEGTFALCLQEELDRFWSLESTRSLKKSGLKLLYVE